MSGYYRKRKQTGFLSISQSKVLVLLGGVISVFMAVNLVKAYTENKEIQDRIHTLEMNKGVVEQENEQLKATLDYVSTSYYVEKQARDQLNMSRPGEQVVSLPPERAVPEDEVPTEEEIARMEEQSNPEKWIDFFFAPGSST